jgi:hypothetical protein
MNGAAAWAIWAAALALYLGLRLFYDGWRRPLSIAEIDAFMAHAAPRADATGNDLTVLRAFLEADDGREFVMCNLVRTREGDVTDPASGAVASGPEWLRRYSDPFVRALMRRGGHPLYVGRKVGGYVDAWNVAPDPGWTLVGTMRYRSRRDMVELVMDPAFHAAHPAKLLGIDATFSFPTQRMIAFYASPRVTVALALALLAALCHIALLTLGSAA